jgi:hypothetical protein
MNASCLDEKGRFKSCPYRVYTDEHMMWWKPKTGTTLFSIL